MPLGDQVKLKSIRRPYLYITDPAHRASVAAFFHCLREARWPHFADWVRSWFEHRNPFREGFPFLSWPCIDYLEPRVKPGMRVLEYGGGGSTIYFLRKGCLLTTVEGDPEWGKAIQKRVTELGEAASRLDLRIVDTQTKDPASKQAYISAVRTGGPWDLILIDGGFRLDCLAMARDYLSPGAFLVFDNTDLPIYAQAHENTSGFQRICLKGLGFARVAPTESTVFLPSDTRVT